MTARINLREYLTGGDRRSLGRSGELVKVIEGRMKLFPQLIRKMWDPDQLVVMRAADAVEKLSRKQPGHLQQFKRELLGLAAESAQPELRWHLALMVPRLKLGPAERRRASGIFMKYLEDKSSIVRTCALQALFDMSHDDSALRIQVEEILNTAARTGTAAMRARSRILLARLNREHQKDTRTSKQ